MACPTIVETYQVKSTDSECDFDILFGKSDIVKEFNDFLPCAGSPNLNGSSHDAFIEDLMRIEIMISDSEQDQDQDNIISLKNKLNQVIDAKPKHIYAVLGYPYETQHFRIQLKYPNDSVITFSFLLFMYSLLMRYIEEDFEDDDSSDECNCCHALEELVYNGGSQIRVYENHLTFTFDCDS